MFPLVSMVVAIVCSTLHATNGFSRALQGAGHGFDGHSLIEFGSKWHYQLTGETVPDGDEWWVDRDGVGWLHKLFFGEANPTNGLWAVHTAPLTNGSGAAGSSTTVYARKEVRLADRDFRFVEISLKTHPAVGALVYVNGVLILQTNLELPEHLTNETTSSSRTFKDRVNSVIDARHFGDRGVSVVGVELHGPGTSEGYDIVEPASRFDLQMIGFGELPTSRQTNQYSMSLNNEAPAYSTAADVGTASVPELPIQFGSVWRYKDDGSDQGVDWRRRWFDDSSWNEGGAELGYGDGDEATTITRGDGSTATFYFRYSFRLNNPASLDAIVIHDDGVIVYCNGVEVFRKYMDYSRDVQYDDYATEQSYDNEESSFKIDKSLLLANRNAIAVEVHSRSADSSDISFDFALTFAPFEAAVVETNSVWKYFDSVSGTVNQWWNGPNYNDDSWPQGPAPLGYGDGDEATTVSYGNDENNKPITTYYRHAFPNYTLVDVHGASLRNCVAYFTGTLIVDDGAVVYINRQEVYRFNLPSGNINGNTEAITSGGERTPRTFTISADDIPNGDIIVGVEVHQRSPSSSDIFMQLEITPTTCNCSGSSTYSVVRPPYLQMLSSFGVIIRWDSDLSTTSLIEYGTATNQLINEAESLDSCASAQKHAVQISGLNADTMYYYRLVGDNAGTTYSFKTEKLNSNIVNFTLWFLGDAGTQNSHQTSVRDAFSAQYPDGPNLMLLGGDNAYPDGTEMQYERGVFQMYSNFMSRLSIWSTLGNHDARSASSDTLSGVLFDSFEFPRSAEMNIPGAGYPSGTEAYYSFDYGLAHIVCLDSEDSDTSSTAPMAVWLQIDIARARSAGQQWLIAFWHHSPYTKGSHDSDTSSQLIAMRQNIVPILESGGVDVVMTGHSHVYERSGLMNGHYGTSSTFSSNQHYVQSHFGGPNNPFTKPAGLTPNAGTVYVTAGSAGALASSGYSWSFLNHPAMKVSLHTRGSLILEFSRTATSEELTGKFLTHEGQFRDTFKIVKAGGIVVEQPEVCKRGNRPVVSETCQA